MLYQIAVDVLLGAAWFVLFRRGGAGPAAATIGVAAGFVATAFRTDPRPDTWSLALLAAAIALVIRPASFRRVAVAYGVLGVLWVNVHGYFVLGILVSLAAGAAALLGGRAGGLSDAPPAATVRRALALLGVALAASLVHPQGWRAVASPVEQLVVLLRGGSPLKGAILEFSPTAVLFEGLRVGHVAALAAGAVALAALETRALRGARTFRTGLALAAAAPWVVAPPAGMTQWPYRVAFALWIAAAFEIGPAIRERRYLPVLLHAGLSVLAVPVLRNQTLVVPTALLLLTRGWAATAAAPAARRRALAVVAAGACTVATWARVADRLPPGTYRAPEWTGWGIERGVLPVDAASFVVAEAPPGPVLTDFDGGGYLLYRLHPQRRVSIAGNTSMYPPEFLARYREEWIGGRAPVSSWADRGGYRVAVVDHASMETSGLVRRLAADPAWRLAFVGAAAAVYVRGETVRAVDLDARTRELAAALNPLPLLPAWAGGRPRLYPALNLAAFLRDAGRPDLALGEVERLWAPAFDPQLAAVGASAAEAAGRLDRFVPRLEEARRRAPRSTLVRSWLARALFARGVDALASARAGEADADFARAARLSPAEAGPLLGRARAAAARGDVAAARRFLEAALALVDDPARRRAIAGDPVLGPLLDRHRIQKDESVQIPEAESSPGNPLDPSK